MINPNDLMLGDWVLLKGAELPVQVLVMAPRMGSTITPGSEASMAIEMYINGERCENLDPIPLTPEWVTQRFGMELKGSNEWIEVYWTKNNFNVCWHKMKDGPYGPPGTITAGPSDAVIQYVHELQNHYRITCKKSL